MIGSKKKATFKSEEGSGLILALMVLLVLSVLGASLGVITIGSLQLSTANQETNSAYYIAEAGANLAYEEFKKNVQESDNDNTISEGKDFFNSIDKKTQSQTSLYGDGYFDSQFGANPTATVEVMYSENLEDKKKYVINSIGKVDGKKRKVRKTVWVQWIAATSSTNSLDIPENTAAILKGMSEGGKQDIIKLNGSGVRVVGNLYVGILGKFTLKDLNEHNSKNMATDYSIKKTDNFSQFKEYERKMEKLNIANSNENKPLLKVDQEIKVGKKTYKITLKENAEVKEIELKDNSTLEIDIKENNVILKMEKLNITESNFKVDGNGTLTIITNELKFEEGTIFNPKKKNVRIVLTSDSEIKIEEGSIAHVQLIAPYSKVTLENPSEVYGSIISRSIEIENKSILRYYPFNFKDSVIGEIDKNENLITSEPAIESDE